jgi:hypothetical protein
MGRVKTVITPQKVSTPGSYQLEQRQKKKRKGKKDKKEQGKQKKQQKGKGKGKGRPTITAKKASIRKGNYRSRYTPEDLQRAFDLVQQAGVYI